MRTMTFLTRTDPTHNIDRFYIVHVTPTLFGDWTVIREWGRPGSPGTARLDTYRDRVDADAAQRRSGGRRLRHDYTALARSG
jgi:predicted DNA-binding WGR domain protein